MYRCGGHYKRNSLISGLRKNSRLENARRPFRYRVPDTFLVDDLGMVHREYHLGYVTISQLFSPFPGAMVCNVQYQVGDESTVLRSLQILILP
jgi:hypothetical protein